VSFSRTFFTSFKQQEPFKCLLSALFNDTLLTAQNVSNFIVLSSRVNLNVPDNRWELVIFLGEGPQT
jgi:hypothetical protein